MNARRSQGIEGGAAAAADPTGRLLRRTWRSAAGEPMLRSTTGTLRFDLDDGGARGALVRRHPEGSPARLARRRRTPTASCAPTRSSSTGMASGTANAMAAALRGVVSPRGRPAADRAVPAAVPRAADRRPHRPRRGRLREEAAMSGELVKILDGNTFVVSDDARRHRGVAHRPDRAVLVRHAVPLPLGADHRRRAPQRALHRRPAVLRDPLLPRPGHRHRLHRRQALGDPPARRGRRFPRGARRSSTTTRSPSTSRCASRRAATSPTCSRSRTRCRRRATTTPASRTTGWCSATSARRSRARRGSRRRRRARWTRTASPSRAYRAARRVDDRPARGHRLRRLGRAARSAQVRAARQAARPNLERSLEKWLDDAPTLRVRLGLAQDDLPAQPDRPGRAAFLPAHRRAAGACPPPACPGS